MLGNSLQLSYSRRGGSWGIPFNSAAAEAGESDPTFLQERRNLGNPFKPSCSRKEERRKLGNPTPLFHKLSRRGGEETGQSSPTPLQQRGGSWAILPNSPAAEGRKLGNPPQLFYRRVEETGMRKPPQSLTWKCASIDGLSTGAIPCNHKNTMISVTEFHYQLRNLFDIHKFSDILLWLIS